MPTGGRLAVQSRLADATQQIQIDFADTGCGIPPEDLNQVFDPFFTTRPVGQGVGLGLTIAYSIAQQHGGNIQVRSAVGVGSTFAVELPLHAAGHFVGGTT